MKRIAFMLALLIGTVIGSVSLSPVAADSGYVDASLGGLAVQVDGYAAGITTTAAPVDIWNGLNLMQFAASTTARVAFCKSSSAADAAAGTGARTITISGLNGNYAPITETFTPTGTTGKNTTATFLVINKTEVLTSGSGATNAGIITCWPSHGPGGGAENGDSGRHNSMAAGIGRSRTAVYTVPAGKYLLITDLYAEVASSTTRSLGFSATAAIPRSGADEPRSSSIIVLRCSDYKGTGLFQSWKVIPGGTLFANRFQPAHVKLSVPVRIPPKATCKMSYLGELGNLGSRVSSINITAGFNGIIR